MQGLVNKQKKAALYCVLGLIFIIFMLFIGTAVYKRYYTGDFVFLDDYVVSVPSIGISENPQFESTLTRLSAESNVYENGMTYSSIKMDEILQSEGLYIDSEKKYLAYTFFIKNTGINTVSIDYYMRLVTGFNWMESYVRILIVEDDSIYKMYQKDDQPDTNNNLPQYDQLPLGINFESETMIFTNTFSNLKPDEIKSFRVIIWLEDQDLDMSNVQQSGCIETILVFSIRSLEQVDNTQISLLSNVNENLWVPITSICAVELSIYCDGDI